MRRHAPRAVLGAVLAGLLVLAAGTAAAQKRIALVIGNGAYSHIGALPNPVSDGRLMARTLESLGFETMLVLDADHMEMKRSVAEFGRELKRAGQDTVGLLFYAGHGVQARGRNYLLPIEAQPRDEVDLDLMGVEANWILRQMEAAGNRSNVIILDACRNNPLPGADRGMSRGLARIDAPTGSFIAYATAPGDTAADGDGSNSPFTTALAKLLPTPGLPVEQVFKQVRMEVIRITNGRQTPWDSSSLVQDLYFNGAPQEVAANPVELSLWQSVSRSGDPGRLALFLQIYPESRFAPDARDMMSKLLAGNPGALLGERVAVGNPRTSEAPAPAPAPAAVAAAAPAAAAPAPAAVTAAPAAVPAPAQTTAALAPRSAPTEHELIARAQTTGALADYRAYVEAYPARVFVDLAKSEIAHLSALTKVTPPDAAQQPDAAPPADDGNLLFDQPITFGSPAARGKSLHQLARSAPEFPPVPGLGREYWSGQKCSNCHNWTTENLCTQGKFYIDKDPAILERIPHPFGGTFKKALANWAKSGCR